MDKTELTAREKNEGRVRLLRLLQLFLYLPGTGGARSTQTDGGLKGKAFCNRRRRFLSNMGEEQRNKIWQCVW